jgi:hypothetical protein
MVTVNGGTVRLEDTPGGGLTVVLELPLWSERGRARAGGPRSLPDPKKT